MKHDFALPLLPAIEEMGPSVQELREEGSGPSGLFGGSGGILPRA